MASDAVSRRLRSVLDTANDAFIAIDADGVIVDWNPRSERVFGYSRAEALGRVLADALIPERYRAAHRAGLSRFLRTGEGPVLYETVELSALRRDGGEFPIELTIWPTTVGDDVTFNAFVRDITERKRVEGLVRLLRTVAVAANESDTAEEAFARCLEEVCTLTGWPVGHVYARTPGTDDLVPTPIWYLADADRFDTFRRITEATPLRAGVGLPGRVVPDGKPVWVRDVTKDPNFPRARVAGDLGVAAGFAFPVLVGADVVAVLEFYSPVPEEPDPGLLEVMADIGAQLGRVVERESARTAMEEAFDSLRTAEQMRDIFLEGVSHDIRTPLSVVLGMASLLVEHADRIEPQQAVDLTVRMRSAALRLERILSDLLDLHRMTQGVLESHLQLVDVGPVLRGVVDMSDTRDHPVELDVEDVEAMVDVPKLERMVTNLVANAVRHTPPGTTVWIRAFADEGLHVIVDDAGPGVPDDVKDRIFEPFVRGNYGDPRPGAGIGLAVVASFAKLHGGRAWVEDRDGGGASFHVQLPGR